MKLLITGASGFVGSRLAAFYKEKYEIWAPSHEAFDFTDREGAWKGVKAFSPDVVLHCGAISDVGTCEKNPELSRLVNVEGTKNLAECCAQLGAKLVYCSSDQVYVRKPYPGEREETYLCPWKERDAEDPAPLYGKHKLQAETLCQSILPDSVGLRLTWMYGALTPAEQARGRRNMEVILREALLEKKPLTLSVTDHRAVTDIAEVVRHMEEAWQLPGGVYNYGSTGSGPIYDTVRRALARAGVQVWCGESEAEMSDVSASGVLLEQTAGGLRNLTMDTGKLTAAGIRFADTETALAGCIKRIMN